MNHNIKTARIQWSDNNFIIIPLITFFVMVPLTVVIVAIALTKSFLFFKSLLV